MVVIEDLPNTYIHIYMYICTFIYIYIYIVYIYIYIYILAEYPPYGRAFQLAPAESITGAFGPINFWGLRPQNLFRLLTSYDCCKNIQLLWIFRINLTFNLILFLAEGQHFLKGGWEGVRE